MNYLYRMNSQLYTHPKRFPVNVQRFRLRPEDELHSFVMREEVDLNGRWVDLLSW